MASIFRRITRNPRSVAIDPRENRLTEAFAAVLERVPGIAASLASEWTWRPVSDQDGVAIATQRLTRSSRFVDLELVFGDPATPVLRVWVENKHGAELGDDQLETYSIDVQALAGYGHVVLVAPRGAVPAGVPDGVPVVEWQSVARKLRRWRGGVIDPVAGWLLDEFGVYLKEEGLADDETLTAAHLHALAARSSSERAIGRIIEIAEQRVEQELGPPTDTGGRSKAPDHTPGAWYATFPFRIGDTEAHPNWARTDLEWTLRQDACLADPRDGQAFFAGATFRQRDNPSARVGNEPWLAALRAEGFERMQSGGWWRLWRHLYPEQLMVKDRLEEQGACLGEWVLDAFRTLLSSKPPT